MKHYPRFFMNRYPRYFICKNWDFDLYMMIDGMYKPVYVITRDGGRRETSWTENGCDSNVKYGYWKEIPPHEIALMI